MTNIYEIAVDILPPEDIDHHCSDLYLRVSEKSKDLVKDYAYNRNVTTFIDQIDHVPWFEIPFAYCGEGWRG